MKKLPGWLLSLLISKRVLWKTLLQASRQRSISLTLWKTTTKMFNFYLWNQFGGKHIFRHFFYSNSFRFLITSLSIPLSFFLACLFVLLISLSMSVYLSVCLSCLYVLFSLLSLFVSFFLFHLSFTNLTYLSLCLSFSLSYSFDLSFSSSNVYSPVFLFSSFPYSWFGAIQIKSDTVLALFWPSHVTFFKLTLEL